MEIHELNTFSGTPGAGDFLATDNGTDTAKISIKTITDPLALARTESSVSLTASLTAVFIPPAIEVSCISARVSFN